MEACARAKQTHHTPWSPSISLLFTEEIFIKAVCGVLQISSSVWIIKNAFQGFRWGECLLFIKGIVLVWKKKNWLISYLGPRTGHLDVLVAVLRPGARQCTFFIMCIIWTSSLLMCCVHPSSISFNCLVLPLLFPPHLYISPSLPSPHPPPPPPLSCNLATLFDFFFPLLSSVRQENSHLGSCRHQFPPP